MAPAASLVLLRGAWENGLNGLGETMSGEIIAILAVGVALAGVILTSVRGLRQDMQAQMGGLRGEIEGLRGEIAGLRERMAHLEGLLEGLREAITGRAKAS